MTVDEIKQSNSMRDIVGRYGLYPNRAGFIHCPFHKGDNTPSMKIYPTSYHCHACGADGDIFSFVQNMEHCDFKTAFYSLGGTYQKPNFESNLAVYRAKKAKDTRRKKEEDIKKKRSLCILKINVYQKFIRRYEPLSDSWCNTYNALQYQIYLLDYYTELLETR